MDPLSISRKKGAGRLCKILFLELIMGSIWQCLSLFSKPNKYKSKWRLSIPITCNKILRNMTIVGLNLFFYIGIITELRRAKRASEAPWVRKIGAIKPRKFGYDVTVRTNVRPSVRPSVRPYRLWEGGGSRGNPNGGAEEFHPFLTWFLKKRNLISVCCQQTIAEVDLTF